MSEQHERPRIACVSTTDATDKRSWSCILYYMAQALQEHCGDVTYINPLPYPEPGLLDKVRASSSLTLFNRRYLHETNLERVRRNGAMIAQRLAEHTFDVIVAIGCPPAIASLETALPIIFVGDCTFAQLIDYYPYYTHLSRRSRREIDIIERQMFDKVAASIFSSEWAARFAVEHYHADPRYVFTVPFGINFDTAPPASIARDRRLSGQCRLLFMAVEWRRKGGDIAFETLLELERMGVEATLTFCGCTPPRDIAHERLRVIPFLDKNDPRQHEELEQLFIQSDFLFLPTRADCAPGVFIEANAFGLPVLTADTGGIASMIFDGENGFVLPYTANGSEYARCIAGICRDEQRYAALTRGSRAAFDERLNWTSWGKTTADILGRLGITRHGQRSAPDYSLSDVRTRAR